MFDDEGLRDAIKAELQFIGEPISDTLAEKITETARIYYREAVSGFALAFLEHSASHFKGEMAGLLVNAMRTQQVTKPSDNQDDSKKW